MPKHLRLLHLILALVLLLVLAACGDEPAANIPEEPAAAVATADEATDELRGDSAEADGAAFETSGIYASDLGFRPDVDGFSFENFGGQGETNLTANDLQRMFGDQACAAIQDEQCILTPPGEQWLQQINEAMSGGHCEGMAVLSKLFYIGQADASAFGASSVPDLEIAGNELLQREIAYWWATQATQPARAGIVAQTPSGVVNTLLTSFAAGPSGSDQYSVGFYKRDFTGGHAVTPYAIEDRGDDIYWIMVYDNNYPGQARAIEVDTYYDTWSYSGSTNPAEAEGNYEGDASTFTLELAPIEPRLGQQECPFCDGQASARVGGLMFQANQTQYNEIWLEGDGDLLITDLEGRSVGFRDGVFVNEISGSLSNANKFGVSVWDENAEPVYYIPTTIDFTISIDGTRLSEPTNTAVTMIGPGYALEVSDIILEPGQIDTIDVSPDGSLISYRTDSGETPFLLVAVETDEADYLFGVYGEEMAPGEALNLSLDTSEGWLSVDTIDNSESGSYSLVVVRYDDQGEQIFGAEGIYLEPDDVLYVDYLLWPGSGEPMSLDLDIGGDGTVDETLQVDDITDEFAE